MDPDESAKTSLLESLGLCRLCRLRYLNVRKIAEYSQLVLYKLHNIAMCSFFTEKCIARQMILT